MYRRFWKWRQKVKLPVFSFSEVYLLCELWKDLEEKTYFPASMGKKIMEMKRIEDTGRRKATFRKRKKGLLKKAEELSILCDAQVSVTVCSETGNVSNFSSHETLDLLCSRTEEYSNTTTSAKLCENIEERESQTAYFIAIESYAEYFNQSKQFKEEVTIEEVHEVALEKAMATLKSRIMKTNVASQKYEKMLHNALNSQFDWKYKDAWKPFCM